MFSAKMLQLSSVFLILAVSGSAGNWGSSDPDATEANRNYYVEDVKQNFNNKVNKMLEDQIKKELAASYVYQAYASYFQRADVNLPGIQKFFTAASAEEKQHAQMLVEYINKRGGHVTFDEINLIDACTTVKGNTGNEYYTGENTGTRMCICSFVWSKGIYSECPARSDWTNGLYAFEDALAVERYVNKALLELHEYADEVSDAQLTHFLEHDFLDEQVKAINELGHFVSRLRSFKGTSYSLGEYLFDQKLS